MTPPGPGLDINGFFDALGDLWKLARGSEQIKKAASETIDAMHVAAQSAVYATQAAHVAAGDLANATAKAKVLKDLVLKATD